MIGFLDSVPSSIILLFNGVVLALVGVWFSRKKDKATMTTENIEGAKVIWDEYKKRMAVMQGEIDQLRRHSGKQAGRISSLEQNDTANQKWIADLESMTEKLQVENKELRQQYADLNEKYQTLKDTVDYDSKPDLRAGE